MKLIQHKSKYYQYYQTDSGKWCMVRQPNDGRIEWFESEEELIKYIETI